MMTEPLNRTAVAQSAVALVIAITLIETVRDLLSVFKPPKSDPQLPYMLMRIMATCVVIALAVMFIYAHPIVTGAEPRRTVQVAADAHNRPAARHM